FQPSPSRCSRSLVRSAGHPESDLLEPHSRLVGAGDEEYTSQLPCRLRESRMRELVGSVFIYLGALTIAQGGPLHDASKSGDLAAIAANLAAGADIEEQDRGVTPLF